MSNRVNDILAYATIAFVGLLVISTVVAVVMKFR